MLSSAGFRLNASSWPMFLLKTLNGAEMAPSRIFHKVPVLTNSTYSKKIVAVLFHKVNKHVYFVVQITHLCESSLGSFGPQKMVNSHNVFDIQKMFHPHQNFTSICLILLYIPGTNECTDIHTCQLPYLAPFFLSMFPSRSLPPRSRTPSRWA